MEIAYKILKNGVCYTEIQAARLEALKGYITWSRNILYRKMTSLRALK